MQWLQKTKITIIYSHDIPLKMITQSANRYFAYSSHSAPVSLLFRQTLYKVSQNSATHWYDNDKHNGDHLEHVL